MKNLDRVAMKMASESPVAKALSENKSCIVVEVYDDGEVNASLRIENTTYEFGEVAIIGGGTIEPQAYPMISPDKRRLTIHCIPFKAITLHK